MPEKSKKTGNRDNWRNIVKVDDMLAQKLTQVIEEHRDELGEGYTAIPRGPDFTKGVTAGKNDANQFFVIFAHEPDKKTVRALIVHHFESTTHEAGKRTVWQLPETSKIPFKRGFGNLWEGVGHMNVNNEAICLAIAHAYSRGEKIR